MRILKIELPGVLRSNAADLALEDPAVQSRLFRELDPLRLELAERIRAKATLYLPASYTIYTRIAFEPLGNKANVVVWVDDPTVSGLSGLLARRAWQLSVPILSHVVREVVQERLQTLAIEIDEKRAKVVAFAPARAWRSPVIVALAAAIGASAYWLFGHAHLMTLMGQTFGGH